MIPQKATQVSFHPSSYCTGVCEVLWNVGMMIQTVVVMLNNCKCRLDMIR
jgi:hypothetical protein